MTATETIVCGMVQKSWSRTCCHDNPDPWDSEAQRRAKTLDYLIDSFEFS